jgi:hypothetical protein
MGALSLEAADFGVGDFVVADRGTRKPAAHTLKAYRQDFEAIAAFIVGGDEELSAIALGNITTEAMRGAFARYAELMKRPRSSGAGRRGTCCAPFCTPRS